MLTFLDVAAGVALILLGVRYLRRGLDRIFGPRVGVWVERYADRRLPAFLTGLAVALVTPSSTAISLVAVDTVKTGQVRARNLLAFMMGADISLTMMVALLALHFDRIFPLFLVPGVLMYLFGERSRTQGSGQALLALGFLFLGIGTLRAAGAAVDPSGDFVQLLQIAESHPLGMAMLAVLLAVGLQSSTATIGLVIGLGSTGSDPVSLATAVAVVVGANVGIAVTTLAVGWSQIDSRRLGAAVLGGKLTVAAAVLPLLPWVSAQLEAVPLAGGFAARVALAHSGFNVVMAALGVPFAGPITRLVERLLPEPPSSEEFGPIFINRMPVESVALALGQSLREILRVAEIVRSMLEDSWRALQAGDDRLALEISERDDQVDLLDAQIKRFLTRVIQQAADRSSAGEEMRQLRYLTELETIGDILDKNVSELVIKKLRLGVDFSQEGARELDEIYSMVRENLEIADTAFATRDRMLAQQLLRHKQHLDARERELRDRHFARLQAGLRESFETSAIHLDLLTYLRRINSHLSHVAYGVVERTEGEGTEG